MTVGEALVAGRERLRARGRDGNVDALRLLEECLAKRSAWIVAHGDEPFDPELQERYVEALERRARGEPVAYIAGTAGFFGRTFAVAPAVLVPRPETEHVVDLALVALGALKATAPRPRVCDVGTGSGAIAITLACEWPAAVVSAVDLSSEALAVAARNASALGVAGRVRFVLGDTLGAFASHERFDCIVANLPYVTSADVRERTGPTAFEPALALDGGPDGLDVYRRLLADAPRRLADTGVALFEAGPDTTQALARLTQAAFPGAAVSVHRDYAGHDRVVEVRRGPTLPSENSTHP